MESSLLQKYLKIVGVVALYWSISITLVFVNKSLLKGDELKLDAPLFVTFYQCVCFITHITFSLGKHWWPPRVQELEFQVLRHTGLKVRPILVIGPYSK